MTDLEAMVLPYLRLAALLFRALRLLPPPPQGGQEKIVQGMMMMEVEEEEGEEYTPRQLTASGTNATARRRPAGSEVEALVDYLMLPRLEELMTSERTLRLANRWLYRLSRLQQQLGSHHPSSLLTVTLPSYLFTPSLVPLPDNYAELFGILADAERSKCSTCRTRPKNPALCLVCGRLVCFSNKCCYDKANGKGEVTRHTESCSANNGVYLLLKASVIVLVARGLAAYFGSVYVDHHGELDINLRRGRPLSLDHQRYHNLNRMYARQTKVMETIVSLRNGLEPSRVIRSNVP